MTTSEFTPKITFSVMQNLSKQQSPPSLRSMITQNFGKGTIYSYMQNILYTDLRLSLLTLPCSLVQKEGTKTNREQSCQVPSEFYASTFHYYYYYFEDWGPSGLHNERWPSPTP